MPLADSVNSAVQDADLRETGSYAKSDSQVIPSDVKVVKESGLYRSVVIEGRASQNGSNEESPRHSFQSSADLYSRSLNDVSILVKERLTKGDESQSEILYLRRQRQPRSQPLTPPSLRHRLLKRIRPKRPWETLHNHKEDCTANVAGQVGQLRRRDRESTQIHTSSDDEDADSHSELAMGQASVSGDRDASTAETENTTSGV